MIKNTETGLTFIKPRKGKYRLVCVDGTIRMVDVVPASKSLKLILSDLRPFKNKKVWRYLFGDKNACRLEYEGSRPIYWWGDDSFMVYIEKQPVYFDLTS